MTEVTMNLSNGCNSVLKKFVQTRNKQSTRIINEKAVTAGECYLYLANFKYFPSFSYHLS